MKKDNLANKIYMNDIKDIKVMQRINKCKAG